MLDVKMKMKENPIENEWWLTMLDLKMKMKENPIENE